MFVALFGSWKEIVMDNWGRSLLQRVRNFINIVDSGQDTAEKYSWLQRTQKACFGFHSALREAMQNPTCRNGDLQSSCIIFEKSGFWGRVKILGVGGLMSIKREVCTMVWLFWLSYPGDRASGLLLSRPVTSVKHSDNFFLANSLSLCSPTPTVDITIIPVGVSIFVGTKLVIAKLWGLHELVKRLEFSFGVFGTSICWRTECLSCQPVLSLFKLMGEANANANGLLSTAISLSLPTRFVLERGTLWQQECYSIYACSAKFRKIAARAQWT